MVDNCEDRIYLMLLQQAQLAGKTSNTLFLLGELYLISRNLSELTLTNESVSVNATVFIIIPKGLFLTTLHYMLIYLLRITSSVSVSATTIIMIF